MRRKLQKIINLWKKKPYVNWNKPKKEATKSVIVISFLYYGTSGAMPSLHILFKIAVNLLIFSSFSNWISSLGVCLNLPFSRFR